MTKFFYLSVLISFSVISTLQAAETPAASTTTSHAESSTPQAQTRPKLMVLQARVDVDKSQHIDPAALTNLISKIADEQEKYQVLSYADVAAMLDNESQKQLLGCTETSCMAEVGQAMGAQFLLYAQVGQVGTTFLTTVNMLDVEKAQVTARESIPVKRSENLIAASEAATQRVFGQKITFVEPKAEPVAQAETNYLVPAKWGLLGAAGLLAVGGIAGTSFALINVSSINEQTQTENLESLHFMAAASDTVAVASYSLAGLLAVSAGAIFIADAIINSDSDGL